jgi:hypothetical protein
MAMVCVEGETTVQICPNTPQAIRAWLRSLGGPADFALEATNDFHTRGPPGVPVNVPRIATGRTRQDRRQ